MRDSAFVAANLEVPVNSPKVLKILEQSFPWGRELSADGVVADILTKRVTKIPARMQPNIQPDRRSRCQECRTSGTGNWEIAVGKYAPVYDAIDVHQAASFREIRPEPVFALPKIDQNISDKGVLCARQRLLIKAERRGICKTRN